MAFMLDSYVYYLLGMFTLSVVLNGVNALVRYVVGGVLR